MFDTGATSCYGSEHEIVSALADSVVDYYARNRNENGTRKTYLSVNEAPRCSPACGRKHPYESHLSYQVQYLNRNSAPFDAIIALHMNSSNDEDVRGTEVYVSNGAPPDRRKQAAAIASAVAATLGTVNRGVKRSGESQHSSLAIVDKTWRPAFLIEFGFVTNKSDVEAVRTCGKDALVAAITALEEWK